MACWSSFNLLCLSETALYSSAPTEPPLLDVATRRRKVDSTCALVAPCSGVVLPGRENHVSFWDLAYSLERWKEEKEAAYRQLRVSEESAAGVAALKDDHDAEAKALADALDANTFLTIDDEGPHFSKHPALKTPHSVLQLRRVLQARMSRVRIEELLLKVDSWCASAISSAA